MTHVPPGTLSRDPTALLLQLTVSSATAWLVLGAVAALPSTLDVRREAKGSTDMRCARRLCTGDGLVQSVTRLFTGRFLQYAFDTYDRYPATHVR